MVDIARAYQEAKTLPDQILQRELSSPSGMLPGYIILGELAERRSIRGKGKANTTTVAEDIMAKAPAQAPIQGYDDGGIVARLNPFLAMVEAMQNPELAAGLQQQKINLAHNNQPPLMGLQPAGPAAGAPDATVLKPLQPGTPQQPPRYYGGGIASLYR